MEALLDLDNSIDYLLCNTFANNNDWPSNNWRAARGGHAGAQWKFFELGCGNGPSGPGVKPPIRRNCSTIPAK